LSEKILVRLLKDCVYGKAGSIVEIEENLADIDVLERNKIVERVKTEALEQEEKQDQADAPSREPSKTTEVSPAEKEVSVDPRLIAWLQRRGFRQLGEKPVWTKHDKIGDRIVRLCIDFQHNRWGSRVAYMMNEDTGNWEDSKEFRDCEELLAYKKFRDELKKGEEQRLVIKPVEAAKATEAGPGVLAAEKDQQILVMVEERDEKQILEEMMGAILKEYVYQIPGQRPRLSYAGVKEAARLRGNIHVTKIEIEETKDGSAIIAKAEVYDLQNNFKIWGVSQQRKKMKLKDGREVDDDFCLTKAVSKAIRNGLRACIPEKLNAELISRWLETHRQEEG
jgi:hypothetical protein